MTYTIKRNDTRQALKATLKDPAGNPVDLTGATVRFLMAKWGNTVIDRDAEIKDAANGVVWFVFEPGDTATAGLYKAEFEVRYADGRVETFPNSGYITINIEPDLG